MNVGELLEELREGILHDVSDLIGGSPDQLWPDRTLVRYINEAQEKFARESECLRDATTPEVCLVETQVGQEFYALHPKIIGILSARFQTVDGTKDRADLARAGHSNLDTYPTPAGYFFNPTMMSAAPPGKTLAYTTDEGLLSTGAGSLDGMTLRVFPEVGAGYAGVIALRVVRMPLERLTIKDLKAVPDIPETYHLAMLDWAAYLAVRKIDVDTAGADAIIRMRTFKADFEETVERVKQNLRRKTFAPLIWGFGRNGWSYEPSYY
jgi:hypothetical protein